MKKKETMCNTIALDPATKTGYAIYQDGKIVKSGTWEFTENNRQKNLYKNLSDAVIKYGIKKIVAEKVYRDITKPVAEEVLIELRSIIMLVQQLFELEYISFIPPTAAKYHLTGRATASKEAMIRAVQKLGYILKNNKADDEADAIAIMTAHIESWRGLLIHPVNH